MPSFKTRSYKKELLDGEGIPFDDIRQNMQELDFINTWLGGHGITISGFSKLLERTDRTAIHVAEIGCGGGDNLRALMAWAKKMGHTLKLTGIDINPECIEFARSQHANSGIDFICSDYRTFLFDHKPDLVFSSLFCHHFTNDELIKMLKWMKENSRHGFFINDLHRHALAYYSISLLTRIFSKSYLVKNDAPLSVMRGFSRAEWQDLLSKADITDYSLHWRWAFRWLITSWH